MGEDPKVVYRPAPHATPEGEVSALAAAYGLVLQVHAQKKKGARPGTPDDVRRDHETHTAKRIVPP